MARAHNGDQESTPSSSPKSWTAEEKYRVVLEAATISDAELGAFLRTKGLHAAQLEEWRRIAAEGAKSALTHGRKPRTQSAKSDPRRIRELERELHRKEKALAEMAALVALKKKRLSCLFSGWLDAEFGRRWGDWRPFARVWAWRLDAHGEDTRLGVSTSFTQRPAMRTTTVLRVILGLQHLIVRGFRFDATGLVVEVGLKRLSCTFSGCSQTQDALHPPGECIGRRVPVHGPTGMSAGTGSPRSVARLLTAS